MNIVAKELPTVALSVRQPWAWLIVNRFKPIENRTWSTFYRGEFLIHASATMTDADYVACVIFCRAIGVLGLFYPELGKRLIIPPYDDEELKFGGIIGKATLLSCVSQDDSPWYTGDYGFLIDDAQPLPFQPLKGKLKFFKVKP